VGISKDKEQKTMKNKRLISVILVLGLLLVAASGFVLIAEGETNFTSLVVGSGLAADSYFAFDGNADDWYIALDDSADDLLIGYGSTVGTDPKLSFVDSATTTEIVIADGSANDAQFTFDGNAQDFYIALDDSADDLLIGLGSTVGTTPGLGIDENLAVTTYGDFTMGGTTPVLTIGDAGEEDATLLYDGAAQDYYFSLDDSADDMVLGLGSTVGTTPILSADENQDVILYEDVTIGNAEEEDNLLIFDGNAQDFYACMDDSADDLVVGLGATCGTTPAFAVDENQVTTWTGGTLELAEVVTAANVLTAAECGKTMFLNSGTEFQTTLPAISTVAAGCSFRFVITAAPSGANYTIITGNNLENVLTCGINELETDTGTDGPYQADGDTITFASGVSVVGDFVYMISDGSDYWCNGQSNADGGVEPTQAD